MRDLREFRRRFGSLGRFAYRLLNESMVPWGAPNQSEECKGLVALRTRDCFFAIARF